MTIRYIVFGAFLGLLGALGLLILQNIKQVSIKELCTPEICVSLFQNGKPISLIADPLPKSHVPLGKRIHKFAQLSQGKTRVSVAVGNIVSRKMGMICIAVRTAEGNLISIPGALPIGERPGVRDPYEILAAIELKNWPNRACHLKKPNTYFFLPLFADGRPIDINPRPDDGRPGLVVVYFSVDVLSESLDDYLFGPVPSSVVAILVGEIYSLIPAEER